MSITVYISSSLLTCYIFFILSPATITSSLNEIQVKANTFFTIFQEFEGGQEQVVKLGTANLRSKTVGVDTVEWGGSGLGGGGGGRQPAKSDFYYQQFFKMFSNRFQNYLYFVHAQDAVCQSHTGRLTGFWFLLNRPKG